MKSMTGFGRATVEVGGKSCTAEIRTVNHRYCEISFRLPRTMQQLEPEARRLLQEKFPRGSISASVAIEGLEDDPGTLSLNAAVAGRYIELLRELKRTHGLTGDIDLNTVALLPDLWIYQQREVDKSEAWPLLEACLIEVAKRVDENRALEGSHLEREFRLRIGHMAELLAKIEARAPGRAREVKERLKSRLELLLAEGELDQGRLAQEMAVLADRIDYTEESVRLRAHLGQFMGLLASSGPHGRRLNFLIQEMGREANTIGSKANDPEISAIVIDLKDEIEKLREQVQNVE
jgi:uncharacterized protein (TIGR00255 family)